jgi:uncharacterized membrane protein YfcA
MDFISLLNVLFIVIYAGILGLVAPYVGIKSDNYGSFVPTSLGVISGSVLWILGTWVGLHYDQVWIWLIVMLGMPAAIWFGAKFIEKRREAGKSLKFAAKKDSSANDDIVILSA